MAENIGLSSYVIRVFKRGTSKDPYKFEEVSKSGQTLDDVLFGYLSELRADSHEGNTFRNISIRPGDKSDDFHIYKNGSRIHGLLDYGKFGYASTLKDRKTSKINYERKTTDTEVIPMYFMLNTPPKARKGIFLFQNYGLNGIKTVMETYLVKRFRNDFKQYNLVIRPFLDMELKKTILRKGKLVSASVFTPTNYSDKADSVMNADAGEDVVFETTMKPRKVGGTLDTLHSKIISRIVPKKKGSILDGADILNKSDLANISGVHEEDIEGFKVDVKYNGQIRTISLMGLGGRAVRFNINDQVERGFDGHPVLLSIHKEAIKIETDILADN